MLYDDIDVVLSCIKKIKFDTFGLRTTNFALLPHFLKIFAQFRTSHIFHHVLPTVHRFVFLIQITFGVGCWGAAKKVQFAIQQNLPSLVYS